VCRRDDARRSWSGDQFCVYVCDRFVVPELSADRQIRIAQGQVGARQTDSPTDSRPLRVPVRHRAQWCGSLALERDVQGGALEIGNRFSTRFRAGPNRNHGNSVLRRFTESSVDHARQAYAANSKNSGVRRTRWADLLASNLHCGRPGGYDYWYGITGACRIGLRTGLLRGFVWRLRTRPKNGTCAQAAHHDLPRWRLLV
jgi:hypothetical protein